MAEPSRIRTAAARDRHRILDLWRELIEHHRRLAPDYPPLKGVPEALRTELKAGLERDSCRLFVAEVDAGLVGFLFAELGSRPAARSHKPREGAIHELYVVPQRRRGGTARALVAAAEGWFRERGIDRQCVRVEAANRDAQRFWRRLGFAERRDRGSFGRGKRPARYFVRMPEVR